MPYSFAHGSGTSGDPYQVASAADLKGVSDYPEAYFVQTEDIDLSGYTWDSLCWETSFTGSYNGNGLIISGLNDSLFGYGGGGGIIKNVILEVNINMPYDYEGGLIWVAEGGFTIDGCAVSGTVTGQDCVGGIAGLNAGTIQNSFSSCVVTGNDFVGGITGLSNIGSGTNIIKCFSLGEVNGDNYVGGIVGLIDSSDSVSDCFSYAKVGGDKYIGGLIGLSYGSVSRCYYDRQTSGCSDTGKGTPKTTVQMKTQATYSGWDFMSTWRIDASINNGYPHFQWQYPLARQTRKAYALVEACLESDPNATMEYNGQWYKFVSWLEEFAVTTHTTVGASVTYVNGGSTVEYSGASYIYICSGITDPSTDGGYGDYKSGTSRTVKSLATRENFVNFYYIEIANADMAIKSPSEIKSANPMIILDAGVSYPIGAKYHFKLTSYADSGAVTQIATVNSKDNPELFKYSLDEGITWTDFPAAGIANTNTKLLVAARLTVGPRAEVWILPSKELVT